MEWKSAAVRRGEVVMREEEPGITTHASVVSRNRAFLGDDGCGREGVLAPLSPIERATISHQAD
jgi:hypothetical protein